MYGFSVRLDLGFEQVIERVTQALQAEGFLPNFSRRRRT
jgi:uncharacterized protein (DUF302 family)